MGRRERKDEVFEQFARVGKALASPKRLVLIDLLAQGERSVETLAKTTNLGVISCSAHLQTLKAAHLVETRKDGVKVYYRLADLPAGTEIVAYCRGAYCVLSYDAVRLLTTQGRTARRLADGALEWTLADLPLATSITPTTSTPAAGSKDVA